MTEYGNNKNGLNLNGMRQFFHLTFLGPGFLDQVAATAMAAEQTAANTQTEVQFWPKHQQADLNERQWKVLDRLLDTGKNGLKKRMSTRKYMDLTKTSRATRYLDTG